VTDASKQKQNESATVESLLKLAHTIDQFEQYTRSHAARMSQLAELIAVRLGLSGADLNAIKLAALLHDIGELAMDAPAVRTTGPLEFKHRIELWRHPIIGEQQLAKRGLSRQVQLLVRWHHEWWNGSGYPDMLSGESIPVGARILRLVDTFDALTAWRPYREFFAEEQAVEIIAASAGLEFDPTIVAVLFDILAETRRAIESVESIEELPSVEKLPLVEDLPPAELPLVEGLLPVEPEPEIVLEELTAEIPSEQSPENLKQTEETEPKEDAEKDQPL
jgi:putative nucleotidyltransferase with HDIG domain